MLPYLCGRLYPLDIREALPALREEDGCVLLETALARGEDTKSYLFTRPEAVITAHGPQDREACFLAVKKALDQGKYLAGWWAYEWGYCLEPRLAPLLARKHPAPPLVWLGVYDRPRIWEHGVSPQGVHPFHAFAPFEIRDPDLDVDWADYAHAVTRIRDLIGSGETYQVNYTTRLRFGFLGDPVDLYLSLRAGQAVPYAAFVRTGRLSVLSFSPELFFRLDGTRIRSRPMKGTIRRGKTDDEDARLAQALASDPKNRAENVMIVDLIRNDIGRLAQTGTVTVDELFAVERYQGLFQMTSTVSGEIRPNLTHREVMTALFPCGSVTGAPKIRTMEIIAGLENSPRGIYTGAIGFLSPAGHAVLNVAIRTVILDGETGEMGLGSGIVIDSDPVSEYEECLLKGRFLTNAQGNLQKRPKTSQKAGGFSLIETMRWDLGMGFHLLDRHLARMARSAQYFGIPWDQVSASNALRTWEKDLTAEKKAHRVRLLLHQDGRIEPSSSPLETIPEPVLFDISNARTDPENPFLRHKTTQRGLYDRELGKARARGLFDRVFVNTRGEITEGCITNVFLRRDGILVTPALSCGLLPGTLREELLEQGDAVEGILRMEDLLGTEEIYLGNSVRGLLRAYMSSMNSPGESGTTSTSSLRVFTSRMKASTVPVKAGKVP